MQIIRYLARIIGLYFELNNSNKFCPLVISHVRNTLRKQINMKQKGSALCIALHCMCIACALLSHAFIGTCQTSETDDRIPNQFFLPYQLT